MQIYSKARRGFSLHFSSSDVDPLIRTGGSFADSVARRWLALKLSFSDNVTLVITVAMLCTLYWQSLLWPALVETYFVVLQIYCLVSAMGV